MSNIRTILNHKTNSTIIVISQEATVYTAVETMCDHNIGCLPVMDGARLVGIFTERDYARKVILQGKASKETKIAEIMTQNPVWVTPKTDINQCMRIMNTQYFRHLPVLEDGLIVGVISIGDLVSQIIHEQSKVIEQLEQYIKTA